MLLICPICGVRLIETENSLFCPNHGNVVIKNKKENEEDRFTK